MSFFGKRTFIINTNNGLIEAIRKLDRTKPDLAKELVREVYELALLSQREMEPHDLHEFVNRSNHIFRGTCNRSYKSFLIFGIFSNANTGAPADCWQKAGK